MDWLRGLLRRVRAFVFRKASERELADELQFHIDMETSARMEEGMSEAEAHRAAVLRFGGMDRFGEESRDARGFTLIEQFRQDTRVALRLLRRNPQFTFAAVLTLALGIGANTAIFSVVDTVLLRASPFAEPDRLVMVWETDRASETSHEPASWPDIVDMRERSRTMESIGGLVALDATLSGSGEPERVVAIAVTSNVPDLLGVTPLTGRTFRPGEGLLTGTRYALLGEEFWRRRYSADMSVIGSTVTMNELPTVILGVLPAEADLGVAQMHAKADYSAPLAGSSIDVWFAIEPTTEVFPRQTHPFLALGRLAPGASIGAAQDDLARIMAEIERDFPENAERGVNVESHAVVTFGPVRPALLVLLGAVALVLLIACVNVANLLLARTTVRAREVAVRRALGAATGRIRRQFLVESIVLTSLGAAAGIALAFVGLRALVALAPADIPRLSTATLDLRVLGFTALVSALVATIFGMAPTFQARRLDLQSVLKAQAGRRSTEGREGRRFRASLVVAEVALAVTLVIGAGLLLRSFRALTQVDPGFNTAGVLKAEYQLPGTRYPLDFSRWPALPEINGFHAQFLERVRTLPGVTHAALTARHPLDAGITNSFQIIGREAESADFPEIRTRFISPGYLETVGSQLIRGRSIEESDVAGAPNVGVINEAAAARYFPNIDPIGHEIRFWGVPWRIVGVIGDERFNGIANESEPAIYTSLAQAPQARVALLVRTAGDPRALTESVIGAFRELDPQLALFGVETLDHTLAASIGRERFIAVLLALFGVVAIALAIVGVHGVLSYTVAQRTSEVGIRMALGASRGEVVGLVVREGASMAAIGVAIGVLVALAGSRLLGSLLFGVGQRDVLTYALVATGMLALAALASWLPARRAARADPMQALRAE